MSRRRLAAFVGVGTAVALLYVALYSGLRRAGLSELPANAMAFALAIAAQYAGQAALTFRKRLGDGRQVARFIVMVIAGFSVSSFVTGLVAPFAGLSDVVAGTAVAFILPVQNFVLMKAWVFAGTPGTSEV